MRLASKIALVSGATGDIGAATALRFAEEGARVLLTDIRMPPDGYLAALGNHPWFRQADLTDEAQVRALFAEIEQEFGRLDVLVNIAGGDLGATQRSTPSTRITCSATSTSTSRAPLCAAARRPALCRVRKPGPSSTCAP